MKKWIQKIRKPFDEWMCYRAINKVTNVIWKYALKPSVSPKYSKKDAELLAIAIFWNNADEVKKVLAYTDDFGNRIYPR